MARSSTTFGNGNPGGPGRPRRETEREYLHATIRSCPVAKWRKIIKKAVEQAEKGDHRARDFLAKYLLGESPLLAELVEQLQGELMRVRHVREAEEDGRRVASHRPNHPAAGYLPPPSRNGDG